MYLKLSLRNAKRSIFDYLLYIATMTILIGLMCISNSIAVLGNMQAGFQTASLPLLIVLIMVVLVGYINTFMLKQRAKEFANYMLLGMEKQKLTQMFLIEFYLVGLVCFILGIFIGTGIYLAVFPYKLAGAKIMITQIIKSVLYTFVFFSIVQALSSIRIGRQIYTLQIRELMDENRRNQPLTGSKTKFWAIAFIISFFITFSMLLGIVFLSEENAFPLVSFISLPLLFCIFSFYKWIYAYCSAKRISQSDNLYKKNHLYHLGEITARTKTNTLMSFIFCSCLLFASMSFVFGTYMLHTDVELFDIAGQQWMGFLQISLCILFIAIYFSILSLQQIIELKRQANNIRILHYLGKSQAQIKSMIKLKIMVALFLPAVMSLILLVFGTPLMNHKLNMVFPATMHNLLLRAVGGFIICFAILYLCYFLIIHIVTKRYINNIIH